jgi:peptidoglycan/xylan/chitin deacetylase (PgdA/CDA1 family)
VPGARRRRRSGRVGLFAFALVAALVFAGALAAGLAAAGAGLHGSPVATAPAATAGGQPTGPVEAAQVAGVWRRAQAVSQAGILALTGRGTAGGPAPGTREDTAGPPMRPAPFARFDRGLVVHVPILMYHRVVPWQKAGRSLGGLVVPPETFEAQMRKLEQAGWHAITAAHLAAYLAAGQRPPRRSFVITFDDGWADGYRYAFPILRRHGFVATYYVVSGRIGNGKALSARQLRTLVAAGMEVGDHTFSHAELPVRTTREARYEIVRAAMQIERIVGLAPMTLAYPFGGRSLRDEHLVAKAGFALAATTVAGCRESAANQFAVPRLRVGPGTSPDALLRSMERCWALDR